MTPTFRRSAAAPTFSSQSGSMSPMATPKVGVASQGTLSTVMEDGTKVSVQAGLVMVKDGPLPFV